MWVLILWILIISFTLYFISSEKQVLSSKYSIALYTIKVLFGVGIGLYYYFLKDQSGDTFYFFKMALTILEKPFKEIFDFYIYSDSDFIFDTPRSALFLKFLIPVVWLSFKNYWLSTVMVASLSYLLLFTVLKRYHILLREYKLALIISFFLFPSVLFWTSGIIKESLAFILILISLIGLLDYILKKEINLIPIILSLISFYFFLQLRYFLAVFLLLIIALVLSREFSQKKSIVFLTLILISIAAIIFQHPVLNPIDFSRYLYSAHQKVMEMSVSGIEMYYNFSAANWLEIIKNLPIAFVNAFIRPFPWEWSSMQTFLYSAENYILIAAFFIYGFHFNLYRKSTLLIILCIVFAMIFVSIATPNFGTLYRYKSVFIPFLLFLLIKESPFVKGKKLKGI